MTKKATTKKANAEPGPRRRSVCGEAGSDQKALSQRLKAAELLIIGEDASEFEEFAGKIIGELRPFGQVEQALAEQVAAILWRLNRIPVFERAVIAARNAATVKDSPGRTKTEQAGSSGQ